MKIGRLTFEKPREDLFPCLKLARQAGQYGGIYPAVVNAANEVAIEAFLRDEIGFYDIPAIIEQAVSMVIPIYSPTLEDILHIDQETRVASLEFTRTIRRRRG